MESLEFKLKINNTDRMSIKMSIKISIKMSIKIWL